MPVTTTSTASPVTGAQPPAVPPVTTNPSTTATSFPALPTGQSGKTPSGSLPVLTQTPSLVPWVIFPLSVGAMTLLLVILAVARTPRARSDKKGYTLKLPED
jgi:hypothetical protein